LPSKKARRCLEDIIENADQVAEYIHGMTLESFTADKRTRDAVERCLQRITEAAIRLDEADWDALIQNPPLHQLRGLGNHLRHDYGAINIAEIWEIAARDLPTLAVECRKALDDLPSR
jgi:uncharacterized protein with HEPN domain